MISIDLIGSTFVLSNVVSNVFIDEHYVRKTGLMPEILEFGTGAERHLLESDRKPRAEKELSHAIYTKDVDVSDYGGRSF